MSSWKRRFLRLFRPLEIAFDKARYSFKAFFGLGTRFPITIATYRGYGRPDRIFLKGRVLKDRFIISSDGDSRWRNFVNTIKRFGSSEIQGAILEVDIGSNRFELKTDEEGYFKIDQELESNFPTGQQNWHHADIHLISTPWREENLSTTADILIPYLPSFGVISDIDDTILKTDVTSLWKLKTLYLTFLKNAGSRRAFREVSAFYRALAKGVSGNAENPFFYVSNSPWNLYDLLEEFMEINKLPKGPIMLRDFGIPYEKKPDNYRGHKHWSITKILKTYPEIPFILIGDSGEKDADIYLSIASEFPGRISAIYIRDVRSQRRARRISRLISQTTNIEIYLVKTYQEAANLAARAGLMREEIFEKLRKK